MFGSKRKRRHVELTTEQALSDIHRDWHIVKLRRNQDQPYRSFLHDKAFALQIVGVSYKTLKYLPWFQDDCEVVHNAILSTNVCNFDKPIHPSALAFAGDVLKHNVEFVTSLRDYMKGESNSSQ